jgi:signal transduction histidine kinase
MTISVEDTGTGIEESKLSRLFTPFTKIMLNRELNHEGVGLGLAISRNLAKAMGGDIRVKSRINKGSKFTVVLPYRPAPPY